MNDSNQISLSGMFWGVVTVSLLVAAASTKTGVVLAFSILVLCIFAGCYCVMKKLQPWISGAIVGFSALALLMLNVVVTTIVEAEMIQGQLYDEDGPAAFFFVVTFVLIVFGGLCAIVGAAVWTTLGAISKRSWDKFEAAKEKNRQQSDD